MLLLSQQRYLPDQELTLARVRLTAPRLFDAAGEMEYGKTLQPRNRNHDYENAPPWGNLALSLVFTARFCPSILCRF